MVLHDPSGGLGRNCSGAQLVASSLCTDSMAPQKGGRGKRGAAQNYLRSLSCCFFEVRSIVDIDKLPEKVSAPAACGGSQPILRLICHMHITWMGR